MIRVNDKISFHSEWAELTTTEFLKVIEIIASLYKSPEDLFVVRLKIFEALTGYKRSSKKYKPYERDQIDENIVFIADLIRFPFKYFYSDASFFELDSDLRHKLRKYHPSEIYNHKLPNDLNPQLQLDLFWRSNPLPYFRFKGKVFTGPVININKYGILETSITAGQYTSMVELYNAFLTTKDPVFLKMLCGVVYFPGEFNQDKIGENAILLNGLHYSIIYTAFYLTQNLLEFLTDVSEYRILFSKSEGETGKISLGPEGSIYNLAKAGYGSEQQISKTNLIKFLTMQIDNLQSFIASCRANEMSDTDISTKYKIPFSALQKL